MDVNVTSFNEFTVYTCDECANFTHININDGDFFYVKMFEYFFSEDRLLRYIENKTSISFVPSKANYAALYKKLRIFIDKENDIPFPDTLEKEIIDVICDEHETIENNGVKEVRLDKIGKIGEYLFSNLLSEYFGFQCIIPKLNLLTDYNMSIFGIDTLFYSPEKKLILLGESKVSKSIANGITLINKSLSTYQEQVDSEFELILSQRLLLDKMGDFALDFGDKAEISLSMSDFIAKAKIESIGIPIFIAFGGNNTVEDVFKQLKRINKYNLYGLNTQYISISLPIIDKKKLVEAFTFEINKRRNSYAENV